MGLLISDAWHTKNMRDKFRIWLMPTGWRPADVAEKYPVYKIEDVYHFEKYHTTGSTFFKAFIWIQLGILLLLISYLFGNLALIGSPGIFVYGAFVFVYVYALTELMDRNPNAWIYELVKSLFGTGTIFYLNDWYGINRINENFNFIFIPYFLISATLAIYFSVVEPKLERAID
jgi:hypothetical protein